MKTILSASKLRQCLGKIYAVLSPVRLFRKIRFRAAGGVRFYQRLQNQILIEGLRETAPLSDISDHLSTLFFFAVDAKPRLIVELGTRGGESTRALLSAAAVSNAVMLSLDIDDCNGLDLPYRQHWHFVKGDDVEFGKTGFTRWCAELKIKPEIDCLFIDTSHLYEHTRQEIAAWSPHLSSHGTMIFHDTNMGFVYARLDRSTGHAWDNQRGVIRAIEEFLGKRYEERYFFTDVANDYLVAHYPHSNGLTVLKKLGH